MPTSTLEKVAGVAIGITALLGALLLAQWGYKKITGAAFRQTAAAAGRWRPQTAAAARQTAAAAGWRRGYYGAAATEATPACSVPAAGLLPSERNDLFPGSYTTFGWHNDCAVDPRNKRC